MSLREAVIEFIAPHRVRRAAIPPLEAGLRPNTALDEATVLTTFSDAAPSPSAPDDLVPWHGGVLVSHGRTLSAVAGTGAPEQVAELAGTVTALAACANGALAAVAGTGIVQVGHDGTVTTRWSDDSVQHGVTALAVTAGDTVLVCVGSLTQPSWEQALVRKVSDGLLLEASATGVRVIADALPWPSGVLALDDGLLLSLSHGHRVEWRSGTGDGARSVLRNLPGYPGRLTRLDGQLWLAVPYMRNRAVELMLRDEELRADMVATLEPSSWLVPRLGVDQEHRVPLQVGQIRVLGEIKPWAPPRTYGLALAFTDKGLVTQSIHSRADGKVHGITGISAADGRLTLLSSGSGKVVSWTHS